MASTKEVSPIIVWKVSPIIVHEPPTWHVRSAKRESQLSELAYHPGRDTK